MPEICRFLGIIITMHYGDHSPPHVHAPYASHKAIIGIRTLQVLEGRLPPRVLGLVVEWAAIHAGELEDDWQLAARNEPLRRIEPLE